MKPGIINLLRSKGLAVAVHLCFWALLVLIVMHLGGKAPAYRVAASYSLPTLSPVPVSSLQPLFAPGDWPAVVLDTNQPSPFYTAAFVPPPKPAPTPPPPPPTTRKVKLTYHGFFQTEGGQPTAMLLTEAGIAPITLGSQVVTNHFIAEVNIHGLTLTNTSGQTNLLLLNIPKELEIPIK